MQPRVIVASPNGGWREWRRFVRVLSAARVDEVSDVLREAESAVQNGNYAAGFVGYEAAPVFDSAHTTRPPDGLLPLAWFALSDEPPQEAHLPSPSWHFCGRWRGSLAYAEYLRAVAIIQQKIADGDVYQVNMTYPRRARFAGSPLSFFAALSGRQPSPWRFYAETPQWAVCSASPECFFEWQNGVLISRPMKGTRANRVGAAVQLQNSEKERAENLMIVDMLRNDMSRLSDAKNVRTEKLLAIEEYPTVLQMTSQVMCNTQAGLHALFTALFPCASVTGAPKIAAMRYIRELETEARGVYCGACGWAGGGVARFAVAIRTAVVDKTNHIARYDSGGGIVADSVAAAEWEECENKAAILKTPPPCSVSSSMSKSNVKFESESTEPPCLLETMYATPQGVPMLAAHLARLEKSARYFNIAFNAAAAVRIVARQCAKLSAAAVLRLKSAHGNIVVEQVPLPMAASKPPLVCLVDGAVSADALLCHKTTVRGLYARALQTARAAGCDDAVLHNECGEITETCIANIAAHIDGETLTPPLVCGLLPGVMRQHLLDSGELLERRIPIDDLRRADKIWRLNAVRGMEEIAMQWAVRQNNAD